MARRMIPLTDYLAFSNAAVLTDSVVPQIILKG